MWLRIAATTVQPSSLGVLGAFPLEGTVTNRSFNTNDAFPGASNDPLDEQVEAFLVNRRRTTGVSHDVERLFLCWAWTAGYVEWTGGLRALARALRGLERTGLIERRRRRVPERVHDGFVLTDAGHEAVFALSGDWIEEDQR
jgi:hypothetical protein